MNNCEFCGETKVTASGNAFHGGYCADCLRLEIEQAKECLAELREKQKAVRKSEQDYNKAKKEAEDALYKLTGKHIELD